MFVRKGKLNSGNFCAAKTGLSADYKDWNIRTLWSGQMRKYPDKALTEVFHLKGTCQSCFTDS
ncbi:MAG: hypothetical protein CSH36_13225 [Thalassolituus sp.]|nr:MAG: hypothetical protein CSH36_13225 [Thalassolituus sp.]